jgi:hypothetical protein
MFRPVPPYWPLIVVLDFIFQEINASDDRKPTKETHNHATQKHRHSLSPPKALSETLKIAHSAIFFLGDIIGWVEWIRGTA